MDYLNHSEYEERDGGNLVMYRTQVRPVDEEELRALRKDFKKKAKPQFCKFLADLQAPVLRQHGFTDEHINAMWDGKDPDVIKPEEDPWRVVPVINKRLCGKLSDPHSIHNLVLMRESAAAELNAYHQIFGSYCETNKTSEMNVIRPAGFIYGGDWRAVRNAIAEDRYVAVLESSEKKLSYRKITVTRHAEGWQGKSFDDWQMPRAVFLEMVGATFPKTLARNGMSPIEIEGMATKGQHPNAHNGAEKYRVQHILPIVYGGGSEYSNLCLMRTESEQVLHKFIDSQTRGMKVGESRKIILPVPPRPFCLWTGNEMWGALAWNSLLKQGAETQGIGSNPHGKRPSITAPELDLGKVAAYRPAKLDEDHLGFSHRSVRR